MNGVVVTFRLSDREWEQLKARARQDEATISDLIREALYASYSVGALQLPDAPRSARPITAVAEAVGDLWVRACNTPAQPVTYPRR